MSQKGLIPPWNNREGLISEFLGPPEAFRPSQCPICDLEGRSEIYQDGDNVILYCSVRGRKFIMKRQALEKWDAA